jgi:hypothetical protein
MKHESGSMDDIDRSDDELEQRLRAYADARLSPDQWATIRMRAGVIEHGRAMPTYGGAPAAAASRGWRLAWRSGLFLALAGVLAVGSGASVALAAAPGGPLYDARVWVETAIVSLAGNQSDAQAALVDQRLGEASDAAGAGNEAGAQAALNAYDAEVAQAIAGAAKNRVALERLQALIERRVDHLKGLDPANARAAAQIDKAIAKAKAALDTIDAKLKALGPEPSP